MTAALPGGPLVACGLLVAAAMVWPGVRWGDRRAVRSGARSGPGRGAASGAQPRARSGSSGGTRPGARAGPGIGASASPERWGAWTVAARLGRRRRGAADGGALELIEALATQVRAGASPEAAWRYANEVVCGPSDAEALGAVSDPGALPRVGGDPARDVARDVARDPAWRALAAAWRMSEQTGAPLADVLDRLAVGLRQEAEVDAEVEASLAAPRATARLLAGLPLVGVALGELIGAHPVAVLVGTAVGRTCGLGGVVLAVAGQLWTRALVDRVVRSARAA